eukprot:TRINITY_DN2149_c0_g2_i2.p1 TRINITY_DN2149_c0_g2~~TRINITY_DN2149_c0_g2_i2.p1  ORF type:complete len:129 (-),score=23.21 TRINITY_DN2149_c0_g2_i2:320-655(-)
MAAATAAAETMRICGRDVPRRKIKLDLSDKKLRAVPAEVCQLTNLSVLYLSDNKLASVPSEISQLTNLTELARVQSHKRTPTHPPLPPSLATSFVVKNHNSGQKQADSGAC